MLTTIIAMAISGCSLRGLRGDGIVSSEKRSIEDFGSLDASGGFEIQWAPGPVSLTITTDQNLLPHIRTLSTNGQLRISTDQPITPTQGIRILLSSRGMKAIVLKGAIHFVAKQITIPELNLTSFGASSIEASGGVSHLTAQLTGASRLKASSLSAKNAEVELVGASQAEIAVSDHLTARITGAGSLTYSGNPSVERTIFGAGSIHHRQ